MTTNYKTRAERRAAARSKSETVLRPAFRRWAYGVAAAGVGVAVFAGWLPPAAAPVIAPLLMAVFYVDETGTPRT
ncbi:hypothetical protein [Microbacterium sp. Leaf320]|uniref:hypothetical protein n=1 Tax=Microbacterium sp. Leaf320 TaxID=1736334 RepID=UPI0006FBE69E|nr:hypothetical protein [Microbacterium sp. Leaf320]KQQ65202.1 hypothetical protein ASF63_14690 [Microbacterium sp. Leaf320]